MPDSKKFRYWFSLKEMDLVLTLTKESTSSKNEIIQTVQK
jgi:hypothetical protein